MPSENNLADELQIIAQAYSVSLTKYVKDANNPLESVVNFISNGISADVPVASLNATIFEPLDYHWVTITEINVYSPDTVYATISNNQHGRDTVNFVSYWSSAKLNGGFTYLK